MTQSNAIRVTHQLLFYSPFSERVGLPVHNILSPFLPVMDMFFVDLIVCNVRFYSL